jgi:Zn-dependent peptidase ImmA (M78 family)
MTRQEKDDLAREAMAASIEVRLQLGLGLEEPICAYLACERLGVPVRFVDVSMEGLYSHSSPPRIFLSAFRPIVRRHFNCAHELGHHIFGHGSKLDELQRAVQDEEDDSPEEFIVNSFAGHLLMPVLGIRRAFARRGIAAASAEPHEIFVVASEYGVSFDALTTQLTFCLNEITTSHRRTLLNARPTLQRALAITDGASGMALIDKRFCSSTLDVEEGYLIVAPPGAKVDNDCATRIGDCNFGSIFQVVKRGIVELFAPNMCWSVSIRVMPRNFVGLARFRFLEDDE